MRQDRPTDHDRHTRILLPPTITPHPLSRTDSKELVTGSRGGFLETPPADETAGKEDEGVVECGVAFPSRGEVYEPVEEVEGLLNNVAESARALIVESVFAGDDRQDVPFSQLAPVELGFDRS